MVLKLGNTAKNSTYLSDLKKKKALDRSHPRHHGIKMQAHHVISAEGMKMSGMGARIERFGYDINGTSNLAFIPCTLQGACYLGVQPHRGNHTSPSDPENDYQDDDEPDTYHEIIATKVKELKRFFEKECLAEKKPGVTLLEKLDDLSSDVLKLIQHKLGKAPLTSIARNFIPGSKIGCGGLDNIKNNHSGNCPVDRNHLGRQGTKPKQRSEGIAFKMNGQYELRTGN